MQSMVWSRIGGPLRKGTVDVSVDWPAKPVVLTLHRSNFFLRRPDYKVAVDCLPIFPPSTVESKRPTTSGCLKMSPTPEDVDSLERTRRILETRKVEEAWFHDVVGDTSHENHLSATDNSQEVAEAYRTSRSITSSLQTI